MIRLLNYKEREMRPLIDVICFVIKIRNGKCIYYFHISHFCLGSEVPRPPVNAQVPREGEEYCQRVRKERVVLSVRITEQEKKRKDKKRNGLHYKFHMLGGRGITLPCRAALGLAFWVYVCGVGALLSLHSAPC